MFCTRCGTRIEADTTTCGSCGHPVPAFPSAVPNYLVQAILVTICCCVPFGIPAIVYAAQVNGKLAAGDLGGALEYSRKAKTWSWIGFGVGLAGMIAYFGLVMVGVLAES